MMIQFQLVNALLTVLYCCNCFCNATTTVDIEDRTRGVSWDMMSTHEGNKFCFSILSNENSIPLDLFIATQNSSVGYNIRFGNNGSISGEVNNGTIAKKQITITNSMVPVTIETNNLNQTIQVMVFSDFIHYRGSFLAIPQIQYKVKGFKYSYSAFSTHGDFNSSIVVVACDNMAISYEGLASSGTTSMYMTFFDSMNEYNSRLLSAMNNLRIEASQPVGFMVSHECGSGQRCLQQLPPSYTWGYNFFIVPFYNITGYVIKVWPRYEESNFTIYCMSNITNVTIDRLIQFNKTTNKMQHFSSYDAHSYCCIQSDRPIAVMQFGNFSNGFMFSVWIAPVSQYLNKHVFTTRVYNEASFDFVNFVSVTLLENHFNPNHILLDNTTLEQDIKKWYKIYCHDNPNEICGYGISKNVSLADHTIKHINSSASINVIVYGHVHGKGYAYTTGFGMNPIGETLYTLKAVNTSALENTKGPLVVQIYRSGDISQTTTVQLQSFDFNGTNAATFGDGGDLHYETVDVTFNSNETSKNASFHFNDDNITEANEIFGIKIVQDCSINIGSTTVKMTIIDDDKFITTTSIGVSATSSPTGMCPDIKKESGTCLSVSIPVTMLLSSLFTAVITTLIILAIMLWWKKRNKVSAPTTSHEYECSKF